MPAPVTLAAETGHQHLVVWKMTQPCLPGANLLSLLHPEAHHLLLQLLAIPVSLDGHPLTPLQQTIQLQWTESMQNKARLLLKLKQAQTIAESKEM